MFESPWLSNNIIEALTSLKFDLIAVAVQLEAIGVAYRGESRAVAG